MTNNARVGGILSIVAGGLGCLVALLGVFVAVVMGAMSGGRYYDSYDYSMPGNFFIIMAAVYGVCAFIGLIVSVLAIVGGISGIRRRVWGLALTGSIAAALAFFPCGIAAIIFTALAKPEFNTLPPAAAPPKT